MRTPVSSLPRLLRSAVLQALAAGACASPVVACGGAVAPLNQDAGEPAEASLLDVDHPGDAEVPFDAGPDVELPFDAGIDVVEPGDAACVLPVPDAGFCVPVVSPCLPPGLVVGINSTCASLCGGNSCQVSVGSSGQYDLTCLCGGGRFPDGLALVGALGGPDTVGSVLARNAALEGAAVRAFEQLAGELAAHGAPAPLVARLRRAAVQEVEHERMLRDAAEARGCAVPTTREAEVGPAPRSLRAIALDNAVEGCGREALGAALLELQSRLCPDPTLRPVLARIAADELGHAELSWELHAWLLPRLDADARAEVVAAHEAFLDRCEHGAPPELSDPEVAAALGLPSHRQWRALVGAVRWGLRRVGEALAA